MTTRPLGQVTWQETRAQAWKDLGSWRRSTKSLRTRRELPMIGATRLVIRVCYAQIQRAVRFLL